MVCSWQKRVPIRGPYYGLMVWEFRFEDLYAGVPVDPYYLGLLLCRCCFGSPPTQGILHLTLKSDPNWSSIYTPYIYIHT